MAGAGVEATSRTVDTATNTRRRDSFAARVEGLRGIEFIPQVHFGLLRFFTVRSRTLR